MSWFLFKFNSCKFFNFPISLGRVLNQLALKSKVRTFKGF
ncbi:hypothetical protein LEP1GSC116_0977 [Leptospira interrogans serovar Icterohaemorrhagiae str. Verdun HP]|uniref:Uncharacterized protein n=1 Tax=Leptospira interrogans serovar Icterohaemorrhagiae str. Verdun HP TaxID=1049910 RepID=M6RHZ8_LEPIR|nr:hypothetical protein LEP1GSC116_0977 [Leptospira interrogans serovar Icterohaemorrhagiae str. Verdun HP]EMO17020.1 hypothetical protein LEP1GSC167_1358 [Leptospira interrogans serovar Copenhageni str. HAI0188]